MILSRFFLNLDSPDARRDLGNPYDLHRTLSTRLLSGNRGLWRLEETQVLLLSSQEPQWDQVPSHYLSGTPASKTYPVDQMNLKGRRFYFRLKANPTKAIKDGSKPKQRGKRVQLVRDDHKRDWLSHQGARFGFRVLDVTISDTRDLRFKKKRGQPEITLGTCVFEGLVVVEDENLFRKCLGEGVGRGKSFGMGLMSIAPAT